MKLKCTVQLHDKELCHSTGWQRSILSLEKKVKSYKTEAYLIWQTEKKSEVIRYLISKRDLCNISKNTDSVSLRYSDSQNKNINTVTICFVKPSHNLVIKSNDDTSLDKFTNLVCMMAVGRWYSFYKMSSVKPNFTLRNTKIVGKKRKYPPVKGFPRTAKELVLRKLSITNFDPQIILGLQNLRVLNLSNNQISFLPKELGTLPLEKLFLSQNCLGNTCSLGAAKWEWMEQTVISQSLKDLNMSNNNLIELPWQIGQLQSLICLNVSNNFLRKVPQIIGTLQHLAKLNLSKNLLLYLPGSMRGMELDHLDVANNPFGHMYIDDHAEEVMCLADLAAKAVKKYRIPYKGLLPSMLVKYLENDKFCCICRESCFHSDIKKFQPLLCTNHHFPLSGVCQSSTIITDSQILFECYYCSPKCSAYYFQID